MHISWLGQTCIKLQTKNKKEEDVVILIDPYRPKNGDFPRSFTPQIAVFSHGSEDAVTLSQNPFVIDTLGEVEVKDVMFYTLPGEDNNLITKINCEGMNLLHLGKTSKKLDGNNIEKIGPVDILFVPVGNAGVYLDPENAAQIVTALEPRMVIPMAYKCDTDPEVGALDDFVKELGLKPDLADKKIIIKKKDLPQEETKLIVLEKNY
ncbi:MBL fold metallo-hydrolase [Patescibacteria group bacterium]|nr:MBL fold metallo-hydrolase [Patescibacteria group bacterium]